MVDVWVKLAHVTRAGAAITVTPNYAIRVATNMVNAKTALVCASPAGMDVIVRSKVAHPRAPIMASVA